MSERPRFGYKLVALPDGRNGIATLNIPKESIVVETGYSVAYRGKPVDSPSPTLMRTDKVQTLSISPVGRPSDVAPHGTSLRSSNPLIYKIGQWTESSLDLTSNKGDGVHFFWDSKTPLLWTTLFK